MSLPPDIRDLIVRVALALGKQGLRIGAGFAMREFEMLFQSPGRRVRRDIERVARRLEEVRKQPTWRQSLGRPSGEHRDLLRLCNLLNLIRKWMVKLDTFMFFPLVGQGDATIVFFQTGRAYQTRETILVPAGIIGRETPLSGTKEWRIQGVEGFPVEGDIEGVGNPTLFARWIPLSVAGDYVPVAKGLGVVETAMVLNILWRCVSRSRIAPWPQTTGLGPSSKVTPTIRKIGLSQIATYTNYQPGCTVLPNPGGKPDLHTHDLDATIDALCAGLLIAVAIHHPQANPCR